MKRFLFIFTTFLHLSACSMTPVMAGPIGQLAWEKNHKEREAWSQELLQQFKGNLGSFDNANDLASFCPKYKSLDSDHKAFVLGTMAVAVALYESSYNPNSIFHEPPPLGIDSVGLFQLSYEDKFPWCVMQKAQKTLENPRVNIECAVPEMAKLVSRDGVLSGGSKGAWKGMARYWSTMRPSGKLAQIKSATNQLAFCR